MKFIIDNNDAQIHVPVEEAMRLCFGEEGKR